jgi:hypothetical protein
VRGLCGEMCCILRYRLGMYWDHPSGVVRSLLWPIEGGEWELGSERLIGGARDDRCWG